MADIEERREARRRKILENSEKRLKKITGVEEKTTKCELDGIKLNPSNEIERESSNRLSSNLADTSPVTQNDMYSLKNEESLDSLELKTIFQNPRPEVNDSVSNCYIDLSEHKRNRHVFILLMPVVLSLSLVLFDVFEVDTKSFYLNKIFVPIIVFELIEYFLGPSVNSPNFLISLLLLTNMRSPHYTNFLKYLQFVLNIVQDIMIYFFVFTVTYWLFQVIFV